VFWNSSAVSAAKQVSPSLAVGLGAQPIFGTQTALGDYSACKGLTISRPPLNPSVAPTVAPLRAFTLWLNGG
jgi:hypothetical protein